jgi:hypothetical protein
LNTAGKRSTILVGLTAEQLVGGEWAEWYRLAPAERWAESEKLWQADLMWGGSLDPETYTQSLFLDPDVPDPRAADGRPGMRVVRRSGV